MRDLHLRMLYAIYELSVTDDYAANPPRPTPSWFVERFAGTKEGIKCLQSNTLSTSVLGAENEFPKWKTQESPLPASALGGRGTNLMYGPSTGNIKGKGKNNMGFFSDLAKDTVKSAYHGLQERAQKVSDCKEDLERSYQYAGDDELFRAIAVCAPLSERFAALSLMLQDRGYSSDEIVKRCNQIRHTHNK